MAAALVCLLVLALAPGSSVTGFPSGGGDPLSWFASLFGRAGEWFGAGPADEDSRGGVATRVVWEPPGRSGAGVVTDAPEPPGERVRELTALRSATSTVFELDDGRRQVELSSVPVRYRDASGVWRDVDTRVVPATDGFASGNDGTGFSTRFGDRSDALVKVQLGERWLTVGVPGAVRSLTPSADGSTVTYAGVWDGADLVFDVTPTGVKESIVLPAAPAAGVVFDFTVRTAGLESVALPDGSVGFYPTGAAAAGGPVFALPKPFMVDAKRDDASPHGQVFSDRVSMTLSGQPDGTATVSVRPDEGWLAADDRVYPVVVDPTITVQPDVSTSRDAMIVSYAATSNFGTDPRLGVGRDRFGAVRSLVRFELAGVVPAGTPVDAAALSLYWDNLVLDSTTGTPVPLEARPVTQDWVPSSVTWNSINAAMGDVAGTGTFDADLTNTWVDLPVTSLVQDWVAGALPNYGFMLKTVNEAQTAGGPIFWAGEFPVAPVGEWPTFTTRTAPKLTVTFGLPAVAVQEPTTVRATGAELSWSAYADPSPASGDDLVEYQVHRATVPDFAPSAATLVAPLPAGVTSYADSTATPDTVVYYRVAVVRADGQTSATQALAVRTPPAGYVDASLPTVGDTTITACEFDQPHDLLLGRPLLGAGYVPGGFGITRMLIKWDISSIPATARIVEAQGRLWRTMYNGNAVFFATHALTREFDETTATLLEASAGVPWTNVGGDAVAEPIEVIGLGPTTNAVWVNLTLTSQLEAWRADPASNHGILFRVGREPNKACPGSGEGAVFVSKEGAEPSVRPRLHVRYTDTTVTFHAAATPSLLNPGETVTVPVTVTNTSTETWPAASTRLGYWWRHPDGTDASTPDNQLLTALPNDLAPGQTVTVDAQVKAPALSGEGNKAEGYTLAWDLFDPTANEWKSASHGLPQLPQQIRVEDPTSDLLGLEKFYAYAGKNTGAGSTLMNNLYAGNVTWSYNSLANPSRGPDTFVRMAYNSLDTSASSMGFGWSLQTSTIQRLGSQLSFHPPGQTWPTQVRATDGDGTSHVWVLDTHGLDVRDCTPATCDYTHPRGVHLYLQQTGSADPTRAWVFTRPDRTQFFFDEDGFQSAIVDNNGNTQTFTYERRKSNNKPTKFLRYITDAAGRRTLTIDYYDKGDTYTFIDDDTWQEVNDTNLTNPFIIDNVKAITDISARRIEFTYTAKGLLGKTVDGAGSTNGAPKEFRFRYDATQGNKNVKLIQVTDPRGNDTDLAYYTAPVDPQNKWRLQTITDRLDGVTSFDYVDPDGPQGGLINTSVVDAENHATAYELDGFGRPGRMTNAKNETTSLQWDEDHNVIQLTEANGAAWTWQYDTKTGNPLQITDAEAVRNGTPGTVLTYQTSLNGFIADLIGKTSPEGRTWTFSHDGNGNLTAVTDPLGPTTPDPDDFTTTYGYDEFGQLTTITDANSNTTANHDFDANGFPQTIEDATQNLSKFVYDVRGNVLEVINAKNAKVSQTYDTFGRPLEMVQPMDAAANRFVVTPAPEYDPNDNITKVFAPNGTVSTSVYDAADQVVETLSPTDEEGDPQRKTTATYDKVGNVLTTTEPQGNLTPEVGDFTTTYTYDEIYQLVEGTSAGGEKVTSVYDNVGNLVTLVDPKKNATADPADYTTKYEYDLNHRVGKTIDATGAFTTARFDLDGLMVGTTDAEGNESLATYDPRGMLVESKVPHHRDGAGAIVYRTTRYEYDEVGNQTKVVTPRGVDTPTDPDDFATVTVYDEVNRVKEVWSAFDPDHSRYKTPDKTLYFYDSVGNLERVSAPPSKDQEVRNDTVYTYYDNGWTRSAKDPWDITTEYDYNELGQQTRSTLKSAGGSTSRTIGWDYYPSGNQQRRFDDGMPVGQDVVLVDSSDTHNTASQGTWTAGAAPGQWGYDVYTADAGNGSGQFVWQLNIPRDGTYEVFVWHPQVSGAAQDAKFTITHSGGSETRTVDQTQNSGTWQSLGSFPFTETGIQKITVTDEATGKVLADAVKLVRDNAGEPDNERKEFVYRYNPNGMMVEVSDRSPGATVDTYRIGYDEVSQITTVEEVVDGAVRNTTTLTYDPNGNPLTSTHDLTWSEIEYDERDMVKSVTNADSPTAGNQQISTFTYTARGQMLKQTKPNGNTVDFEYFLDGAVKHQVEKTSAGTVVAEHTLQYTANGHPSRDVLKLMNADNPADHIDNTYVFSYDPRDWIERVDKTGDSTRTETYVYDANSNVIEQSIDDVTTVTVYDRNRLHSSTTAGVTSTYNYDPLGRLDTVSVNGERATKYSYDGFDRTARTTAGVGETAKTTTYVYDPFDRTVSQTAGSKTTAFTYLGMDNQVLREVVDGQDDKSYQYAPWGQQLTQIKHNDDGSREYSQYVYRPRGDVVAITKEDGTTRATYGYTAYGKDDESQFTGADAPGQGTEEEPYNAFRFNASRWDPGSGTYDMGFRNYDPGLNRFLSRDMYAGALSDMALVTDPFTGNRYSFAGGNPISFVELDGHLFGMSWSDIGHAALDVVGMVPVVGEVADVANGIWYLAEGNYVDAAFSLTSAIPLVGNVATAAKWGKRGLDAVDTVGDVARNADNVNDAVRAGDNVGDAADTVGDVNRTTQTNDPDIPSATRDTTPDQPAGPSCRINSFVPGTQVVLADGSSKPIEQLVVGDRVLATDVESGDDQPRVVTNVRSHAGGKDMVTVTIDTDGGDGARTGSFTSTAEHLVWLPDVGMWVKAVQLQPGMWLQTGAGTWVQITAVERHHTDQQRVHNLTVAGVHTYHVLAGDTPLLVHNASGCGPDDDTGLGAAERAGDHFEYPGGATGALHSPQRGWFGDPLSSGSRNINPRVAGNPAPGTKPGFEHHLEAQAAALMRKYNIREATLFIHFRKGDAARQVCGACDRSLADMLPEGASLTVVFRRSDGSIFRSDPYTGNAR